MELEPTVTQAPPQQAWDEAHVAPVPHWQDPATQLSPALHVGEQGTSSEQTPPMQTRPASQALPQPPQLPASVSGSTQAAPQHSEAASQAAAPPQLHIPSEHSSAPRQAGVQGETTQDPASQVEPASQRTPHAPQLMESSDTSTHRPPQQPSGAVQGPSAPQRHSPDVQRLAVPPQSSPHPPQSVRLFWAFTQAPSQQTRPPPQVPSGEQTATHTRPRQTVSLGQAAGQVVSPPASSRGTEASMPTTGPESLAPPPFAHPATETSPPTATSAATKASPGRSLPILTTIGAA